MQTILMRPKMFFWTPFFYISYRTLLDVVVVIKQHKQAEKHLYFCPHQEEKIVQI